MYDNVLKISEIFYSIQGEGLYTGTPSIFIRFAGCNLNCIFCDTPQRDTINSELSPIQVIEVVEHVAQTKKKCRRVVLTGGEPGYQSLSALTQLCQLLHEKEYIIAIETNGTLPLPLLDLDWITVSPKTPVDKLWLSGAHEIKIILAKNMPLPNLGTKFCNAIKFVQPMADKNILNMENIEWCVNIVRQNPGWRLSMQLHKIIGIQ